jgi:uncharacterized protein
VRHADGREALIELVGFWTPDYLEEKARKVAASGLENLVLVVSRRLGIGAGAAAMDELAAVLDPHRVVWFTETPRAGEVMRAVERCAQRA